MDYSGNSTLLARYAELMTKHDKTLDETTELNMIKEIANDDPELEELISEFEANLFASGTNSFFEIQSLLSDNPGS